MNAKEIMKTLKRSGDIYELYEIKMFRGYRKDKTGQSKNVDVSVFDMGEDCDNKQARFYCSVIQSDGKTATGNEAATVEEAIEIVHWFDLD